MVAPERGEAAVSRTLEITDPRHRPELKDTLVGRFAMRLIRDERDIPFIQLILQHTFIQIPIALALFVPGVFRWWMAPLYWALTFGAFFDRFILMLHNTSHRPLFKKELNFLNNYIPWVIGPFNGQTPETYYAHHMGMHHPENNLEPDLSCTMPYQRDSLPHFLHYWGRFFLFGIIELPIYHARHKNPKYIRRLLTGEASFVALCVLLSLYVSWEVTFTVFVVPLLLARWLMMCGNWSQHAFLDKRDPNNPYINSITCINTRYNRRCFNDGYHIGHHERAARHWTDMPEDFEKKREKYRSESAVVFEGIDYFQIWFLLMLKRYDTLAKHFVDLEETPRTKEEIIALLKERVKPIIRDEREIQTAKAAAAAA
jgi:fatty acid desaturase